MSKHEMIEAIRAHNRSAHYEFLNDFDETDLRTYLRRLTKLNGRRGRDSVWVRQSCDPLWPDLGWDG